MSNAPSHAALLAHLERVRNSRVPTADVTLTNLLDDHELWSVDGPFAWEVAVALLGPEVLGAPYLSFLKLKDLTVLKAPYGELPDLAKVDWSNDVVFTVGLGGMFTNSVRLLSRLGG